MTYWGRVGCYIQSTRVVLLLIGINSRVEKVIHQPHGLAGNQATDLLNGHEMAGNRGLLQSLSLGLDNRTGGHLGGDQLEQLGEPVAGVLAQTRVDHVGKDGGQLDLEGKWR